MDKRLIGYWNFSGARRQQCLLAGHLDILGDESSTPVSSRSPTESQLAPTMQVSYQVYKSR